MEHRRFRLIIFALMAAAVAAPFGGGCANTTSMTGGSSMSDAATSRMTDGVEKRTLDNGLTVLVKEDHDVPVVAIVTYVKAGYFHETEDQVGISHVIEHMYFNGTPTRPDPEQISRETKAIGGSLNAGTIYDRTSYYVVLPSDQWEQGLAVQADAFQNPLFDETVLGNEIEAILQEARRKLDSPGSFGREKMFELAFSKHRMRRWRIGEEGQLRAFTVDDLRRFYDDHYRPSNTVLAIVGDVDAEAAMARVEELYGDHPAGELRKKGGPAEPDQPSFQYQQIKGDVTQGYTFLGFHTPGVNHPDRPALDVLATILGSGRSSRLTARLREDIGVVTSISASSYAFEDVGMFEIDAVLNPNGLDYAIRETFVEIERLKQFGVTSQELDRARGMLESTEAFAQEEVLGQASTLASYEARGDYRDADADLAAMRAVTAEDVQRVARQYLHLDNATLLEYVPEYPFETRLAPELRDHIHGAVLAAATQFTGNEPGSPGDSVLPRETLGEWSQRFDEQPGDGEGVHTFALPQGATLVVKERRSAPTVAFNMYFRGGRIFEPNGLSGTTRMMQRVMVKETYRRELAQLALETESMGTGVGRVSHDDYFGFSMATLRRDFPRAFDVMFDVVSNPFFTWPNLQREKEAQSAAIQSIEDQSGALATQLLRDALYGEHPYGRPELGSPALIRVMTPDRLVEFHSEVVHPEALVITVVGDVDATAVQEFVSQYIAEWTSTAPSLPASAAEFYSKDHLEVVAELRSNRDNRISKDRAQTASFLAFPTVPRTHADTYPLEVLQSVTGGLGGTFFEEIRTQRGLAYQVHTFDTSRAMGGHFGTFVACSPENAPEVEALVWEMMQQLAHEAPSEEATERARNYLAGSYLVGTQTNRAQAAELGALSIYGQDLSEFDAYPEKIRAVESSDLQRVAETYFLDKFRAVGAVDGNPSLDANPD